MRLLRIVVNWVYILVLPPWVLVVFYFEVFRDIKRDCGMSNTARGRKWFWE